MISTKNSNVHAHPWTEDPLVAYKNFLKAVDDDVNNAVTYNQSILGLFAPPEIQEEKEEFNVCAKNGSFHPLKTVVGMPLYCSKLTLRNIQNAIVRFVFDPETMPNILGIEAEGDTKELVSIAYRNIVTSEFETCPQLAGPMGFHEYLIDGNNYNDYADISFYANSDWKKMQTPLKIVLENCKGTILVIGLDKESYKKLFENRCEEKGLHVACLANINKKNMEAKVEEMEKEQYQSPSMRR